MTQHPAHPQCRCRTYRETTGNPSIATLVEAQMMICIHTMSLVRYWPQRRALPAITENTATILEDLRPFHEVFNVLEMFRTTRYILVVGTSSMGT